MSLTVPDVTYQFRRSLAAHDEEFTVTAQSLLCSGESVPFQEITSVRVYAIPGVQMLGFGKVAPAARRCTIHRQRGASITLVNLHYVGIGNFEDRSAAFLQFVSALVARVRSSNPAASILSGMPPQIWWSWLIVFGGLSAILVSCILLGFFGLLLNHQLSLGTGAFLLVLVLLLIAPASFLRILWRSRSRPLGPEEI